ncbi:ParA family protein [Nocardia rhamnosiphila]
MITLGNLKGGASKTTSSFFLAVFFAKVLGLRVLVLDADPLSQTGYSWYRRLKRADVDVPFDLEAFPSKHIGDKIEDVSDQYDVIIVDAGGESDEIFKAAVRCTNELLLVAAPSYSEMNRLPSTYKAAVEAAQDVEHDINVRVLLTRVPVTMRATKDGAKENISVEYRRARKNLAEAGYIVFESYVSVGRWYRDSADAPVGGGGENPIIDLGEYHDVGIELVQDYQEEAA